MKGPIRECLPAELPALVEGALAERYWLAPTDPGSSPPAVESDEGPELAAGGGVILQTSGSTGQPKGVCLPGSALVAGALSTQQLLGPLDWAGALPLQYVAGLMTLVRARVAGREFVPVPSDLADFSAGFVGPRMAPRRMALSIVATHLHRALKAADEGDPTRVAALANCEVVLVGGSAVAPDLLERARSAGINAIATYGMSETCGGCVYDGVPLPGVQVSLLDDSGHAGGLEGRIAISGPMLFSGYRDRPDLTAETLVDGRVLTRDRGRWRDGRLEVLGRIDDVVISGGVNVDLAAVQATLDGLAPGRGVVVAAPDPEWGAVIWLVVAEGVDAGEREQRDLDLHDLDKWRARLRAAGLQAAALPKRLLGVEALPRTISGKIDRQRLLELVQQAN